MEKSSAPIMKFESASEALVYFNQGKVIYALLRKIIAIDYILDKPGRVLVSFEFEDGIFDIPVNSIVTEAAYPFITIFADIEKNNLLAAGNYSQSSLMEFAHCIIDVMINSLGMPPPVVTIEIMTYLANEYGGRIEFGSGNPKNFAKGGFIGNAKKYPNGEPVIPKKDTTVN